MKIHSVKVLLDKEIFNPGDKVTGKIVVASNNENWGKEGKAFVKFIDKLNIEWVEEEITVADAKRVYSNFKRPFQVNFESVFDNTMVVAEGKEGEDFIFSYPFEYQLPSHLLGTHVVQNAKHQYFIKAYLTHDENVSKHYLAGVNIFDEFFMSLNHTFVRQEVVVLNKLLAITPDLCDKHTFEAKSSHLKVVVTLPKLTYHRGETVQLHLNVERSDGDHSKALNLQKVGFKLFQVLRLISATPSERVRLFEHMLSHSSRKHVHQNDNSGIIIEEFIQIPKDIPSSSSRSDTAKGKDNPIRVNYKIRLEFWKSLFYDELDVNIPLLIDPEA